MAKRPAGPRDAALKTLRHDESGGLYRHLVGDDPLFRIDTVIINSLFGSIVILYALLILTRVEFTLESEREPLSGRRLVSFPASYPVSAVRCFCP